MDHYQGVVLDYLRADRAIFLNPEYCIQLDLCNTPTAKGRYWFSDVLALDFTTKTVWLCEITYSLKLNTLRKRMQAWSENWSLVQSAIRRDSSFGQFSEDWSFRPWLFVPARSLERLESWLRSMGQFKPRVQTLECVVPWEYQDWSRTYKPCGHPIILKNGWGD